MRKPAEPARCLARALLLLLATFAYLPAARSQDGAGKPVALTLEVAGKAETQVGGRIVPVAVLAEFARGDRVRVQRDAKLTVLFYAAGTLYSIDGPSLVRFDEAAIETLSGNEPVLRRPLSGKDGKPMRIHPGTVTEAATVLRGLAKPIPALALGSGLTLEPRPVFRWKEVEPGLEYRFTLKDTADKIIVTQAIRGSALALPPDIALAEGQAYRWTISAKSAAGLSYASTYRFAIADRARREQAENFRPSSDAPISEQVAYAIWLAQAGFGDEAARQRERLAAAGIVWPAPASEQDN